jgi:hypothetical protein
MDHNSPTDNLVAQISYRPAGADADKREITAGSRSRHSRSSNSGPIVRRQQPHCPPTDQDVFIRLPHQRRGCVRLTLEPRVSCLGLQDEGHTVVELSGELAGLRGNDDEDLRRLRLVFAALAIAQTSDRHRLTVGTREVVRLSVSLRAGPSDVTRRRHQTVPLLAR